MSTPPPLILRPFIIIMALARRGAFADPPAAAAVAADTRGEKIALRRASLVAASAAAAAAVIDMASALGDIIGGVLGKDGNEAERSDDRRLLQRCAIFLMEGGSFSKAAVDRYRDRLHVTFRRLD